MRTASLAAAAPLLAVVVLGGACSSKSAPPPAEGPSMTAEQELTTPPLPAPTYAGDSLPPHSAAIVTDLVPVRVFTPRITSVSASYVGGLAAAIVDALTLDEYEYGCIQTGASLRLGGIVLQGGGARVAPQSLLDWSGLCMSGSVTRTVRGAWTTEIRPLPFPAREALLRRTVRWAKLDEATMHRGGSYTNTVTVTNGSSVTDAAELSFTVGISGAFDFLTLSAELTTTLSHSVTVETETSESEALTCAPDATMPGDEFHCSFWQLEEIYEVVDREGAPWADPFYVAAAPPALVSRTQHRRIAIVGF